MTDNCNPTTITFTHADVWMFIAVYFLCLFLSPILTATARVIADGIYPDHNDSEGDEREEETLP